MHCVYSLNHLIPLSSKQQQHHLLAHVSSCLFCSSSKLMPGFVRDPSTPERDRQLEHEREREEHQMTSTTHHREHAAAATAIRSQNQPPPPPLPFPIPPNLPNHPDDPFRQGPIIGASHAPDGNLAEPPATPSSGLRDWVAALHAQAHAIPGFRQGASVPPEVGSARIAQMQAEADVQRQRLLSGAGAAPLPLVSANLQPAQQPPPAPNPQLPPAPQQHCLPPGCSRVVEADVAPHDLGPMNHRFSSDSALYLSPAPSVYGVLKPSATSLLLKSAYNARRS